MKNFFALLALVSGLLIFDARADDTAKWCVGDRADVDRLVETVKSQNFPTRELDETNAVIFLALVQQYGFIENIPSLPGTKMIVLINPGVQVWGIIVRDDKWCARLTLGWQDYQAIVEAMKPKSI